jgi:membrane protease YdiL (CAAX protease family)
MTDGRTLDRFPNVEQHSLLKSVALHLLPGAIVMGVYVAAAPLVMRLGFPPGVTLLLGFLLIGGPIELGYLLYLGKKRNGKLSLRGIVLYREAMPIWQYAILFLLLLVFAFTVLFLISPVTQFLAEHVFDHMPGYLLPDGVEKYGPFAPTAVLITLVLGLVLDGFTNPIIEELYFRGYLLPRISRFGLLAPLMSAFLFSVQHYWQPFNWPLIFIIQIAIVYVVWWKRNIYISMLAHCAGNTIGAILSLISFLSSN